jgi:hypothetical protein
MIMIITRRFAAVVPNALKLLERRFVRRFAVVRGGSRWFAVVRGGSRWFAVVRGGSLQAIKKVGAVVRRWLRCYSPHTPIGAPRRLLGAPRAHE